MTGRRITAVVFGAVMAVVGVVLIFGALGPLTEYRDTDGFYMGDPFTFERPSFAIVSGDIDILKGRYPDLAADSLLLFVMTDPVDVRMQGVVPGPGELFLGIAPTTAVDQYLGGVAHDEIKGLVRHEESHQILDVEYATSEGTGPPGPPGTETFWVTSVVGTGLQTLDWTIESGDWTTVIMNADAASGVTAELAFGAAVPRSVKPIAWTMVTVGLIALISGGLLVFFGLRRPRRGSDSGVVGLRDEQSAQQTDTLRESPSPRS